MKVDGDFLKKKKSSERVTEATLKKKKSSESVTETFSKKKKDKKKKISTGMIESCSGGEESG